MALPAIIGGGAAIVLAKKVFFGGSSTVTSNVGGYQKQITDAGDAMASASTYLLYAPLTLIGFIGGTSKGVS